MQAQRKDELEAQAVVKQSQDQMGLQKRDQANINFFMAWALQHLLPEQVALFAVVNQMLKQANLQADAAINETMAVSKSAEQAVQFKPKSTLTATNVNFRAKQAPEKKVSFRNTVSQQPTIFKKPSMPTLPLPDTLRKTKKTVKDVRQNRVEFRHPTDTANINGPSPKAIATKAEQTLHEKQEQQNVENSPEAPSLYYKPKKKPGFGFGG